jgi:DNA-binding transcriptional regulator YdaS (Cro superfamily)
MKKRNRDQALIDALALVGGVSALARELGITRAAVSQWYCVPFRHLRDISRLTGMPRAKLRPDLYDET